MHGLRMKRSRTCSGNKALDYSQWTNYDAETTFCALQLGYTGISRTVAKEWSEGWNLLSRMTCYFYINVAGREVNETPVLSVEIVVWVSLPPPTSRAYLRRDWSRDDRNKRVSSLRQTHPAFTSIVTLRTEISEELPLYQRQMPFGQSSSFRERVVGFLG